MGRTLEQGAVQRCRAGDDRRYSFGRRGVQRRRRPPGASVDVPDLTAPAYSCASTAMIGKGESRA